MTTVSAPMLKAASAAYMVSHPGLNLSAVAAPGGANGVFSAYNAGNGGYDYAINSIAPTSAMKQTNPNLRYYPLVANGVAIGYNLGVTSPQIILTLPTICDCARGNISFWNDSR